MSNRRNFLTFVFLFTFLCVYHVHAQSVTVSIPKGLTATPGASGVKVPVNVSDLTGLGVISVDLTVSYDTSVLTATSATVTDTIAQGSYTPCNIDDANGTIDIAIVRPTPPLSGSGALIFIFFDVDSDNVNDSSPLSLTEAKLNSDAVPAETSDGEITLVDTLPVGSVLISIPNLITTPGATGVQVPINVQIPIDVTDVISANLIIGYDTDVLTATGATFAGTIVQGGGPTTNINDVKGEISLAIASSQPLSGNGVLVFIIFDVDSDDPTDVSALTFKKAHLNGGEILTVTSNGDISLPVTISSFVAAYAAVFDKVFLEWQVESEFGNLGFALYRSERKNGPYTKIGWVASKGDTQTTRSYRFIDETAEEGKVYFYMLEHIDITGKAERFPAIQLDWPKLTTGPRPVLQSESLLFQNYPNPFNPETWIPYALATDSDISILIYNGQGHLARQLSLRKQSAGSYITKDKAVSWDGRNSVGELVSSGVYFYMLRVRPLSGTGGDFVATRKMVILK